MCCGNPFGIDRKHAGRFGNRKIPGLQKDSGIIDQDVRTTELTTQTGGQSRHGTGVGHIGNVRQDLVASFAQALGGTLDGFGATVSVSLTDSNISIQDPPGNNFITGNGLGDISLPGLSKTVWNAMLYYEKYGFSARIATRARSKYIGEVTNFANDRSFKFVKGDQITDLQVGYAFGDATRLRGVSMLLQVNNLTNEPYIAYARIGTRQQDYQEYGRQVLLGINYKLQ